MRTLSKPTGLIALAAFLVSAFTAPADARDSFVLDGGSLFSTSTVSSLNQTIGDFNRQTGKEVVVVTVPSLDGVAPQAAAEKVFAQQQVNGVLIFLAKTEKKVGIIGDRASATFFPSGSFDSIRQAMRGYFRDGDFNTGITTGVGLVINGYRGHERSLQTTTRSSQSYAPTSSQSIGGGGMSLFWLILILIAGFLIIRAVFRAIAGGNRTVPPGYGGPGMGGPGYGGGMPGYGGGGGGGSFFSGLLGGLGGAFLGNELFGHQNFGNNNAAGFGGDQNTGNFNNGDSGGWQSDPGQADTSNSSFGDFGSSGGGFGDGGGGGFGDGGGGGDSGGGW